MPQEHRKDEARGLYPKFEVRRSDGSSGSGGKHERCRYFVLDLDHDKFSVPALEAYHNACSHDFPALAADLKALVLEMRKKFKGKGV